MKNLSMIIVPLLAAACNVINPEAGIAPGSGGKRDKAVGPPGTEERMPWEDYPFVLSDTTLWFSAVVGDSVMREVCLYRNWEPVLSVPVASGAACDDTDLNHILNGNLYTECPSDDFTTVFRNGVELFSVPGREYLSGILERGRDIYSLSSGASGKGFILRKNGVVLLARDYGRLFGDLHEASYSPGGALYEDCGHYYFSYVCGDDNYYLVEDGREMLRSFPDRASPLQDIKIRNGLVEAASWRLGYVNWEDARLWHDGKVFVQTGDAFLPDKTSSGAMKVGWSSVELLPVSGAVLYYNGRRSLYGVSRDRTGIISIYGDGRQEILEGRYSYFSPSCGKLLDDGMILALNPVDSPPMIWYRGKEWPVPWVDGTISEIQVDVSRSN